MTITTPTIKTEHYTLPAGEYVIGCPSLLTCPNSEPMSDAFYQDGMGKINGHKYLSVSTGMDGFFRLYDMDADEPDDRYPEHVDTFLTDVALMSIIPVELIPDYEDASEYGKEFCVLSTDNDGNEAHQPIEVKVHRDVANNNRVMEVDIEWYKLVIWNDKRFGGAYGAEE